MKGYAINGKKTTQWFFTPMKISLGYDRSQMNWGNGHITVFKTYFFLFWQMRITQAYIKMQL